MTTSRPSSQPGSRAGAPPPYQQVIGGDPARDPAREKTSGKMNRLKMDLGGEAFAVHTILRIEALPRIFFPPSLILQLSLALSCTALLHIQVTGNIHVTVVRAFAMATYIAVPLTLTPSPPLFKPCPHSLILHHVTYFLS